MALRVEYLSVSPTGDLWITGIAGESPYVRGLLDMLGVGLITPEVENTLPADLLTRLQQLKDNPEA